MLTQVAPCFVPAGRTLTIRTYLWCLFVLILEQWIGTSTQIIPCFGALNGRACSLISYQIPPCLYVLQGGAYQGVGPGHPLLASNCHDSLTSSKCKLVALSVYLQGGAYRDAGSGSPLAVTPWCLVTGCSKTAGGGSTLGEAGGWGLLQQETYKMA